MTVRAIRQRRNPYYFSKGPRSMESEFWEIMSHPFTPVGEVLAGIAGGLMIGTLLAFAIF